MTNFSVYLLLDFAKRNKCFVRSVCGSKIIYAVLRGLIASKGPSNLSLAQPDKYSKINRILSPGPIFTVAMF